MITNITLENFKCFRQVSINPKLLTVLIGPNGTGKSSILQALLLLKQSLGEKTLKMQGEQINFPHVSTTIPLFLNEETFLKVVLKGVDREFEPEVTYDYTVVFSPLGTLEETFGALFSNFGGNPVEIRVNENDPNGTGTILFGTFRGDIDRVAEIGNLVDGQAEPDWQLGGFMPNLDIKDEFFEIASVPWSVLDELKIVPAARGFIRPQFQLGEHQVREVALGIGFDKQEEQAASNIAYSRQLEERVAAVMTKVTGSGLLVQNTPPRSVEVISLTRAGGVNMVAEGFGTNALVLLFHQLLGSNEHTTVLIEEPEIHLHPKAQADLAEVLADTAKAEDKQIIMTTHSEHLVERLLLLVAEGTLAQDELAIYSFSKDEKGECFATEIVVTENGQVDGGLTDFYANNLDTLDRRVKALKRSK